MPRGLINFLQAFSKNWVVLKKLMVCYFSVSAIVDLLKGGTRQMCPMPSFFIRTCWNPQFFIIKYLMYTVHLTKCLFAAETFALIHWQALGVKKTNALKRKEKIGSKLDLGNCEKTKVFLIWHLPYFFSNYFENLNV